MRHICTIYCSRASRRYNVWFNCWKLLALMIIVSNKVLCTTSWEQIHRISSFSKGSSKGKRQLHLLRAEIPCVTNSSRGQNQLRLLSAEIHGITSLSVPLQENLWFCDRFFMLNPDWSKALGMHRTDILFYICIDFVRITNIKENQLRLQQLYPKCFYVPFTTSVLVCCDCEQRFRIFNISTFSLSHVALWEVICYRHYVRNNVLARVW